MASSTNSTSRSIYLDTNSAQQEMKKLQLEADKLKLKIDSGELSGDKLNKTLAKLDSVNAKIKSVQDQFDKGLEPSLRQQQSLVMQLANELTRMSQSDPAFAARAKVFQQQNQVLTEMREKVYGVKKAGEEMGSTFSKVFSHVAEAATAYFAFESIKEFLISFVESSIEEAEQAEKATTRIKNVLENLGRTDAFDHIIEKANELADEFKSLDNDNITEVYTQLITYGKLTQKQMDDLLPVIIDFAAESGTTINESASVIIKAMEGNAKALKEYGINIKDGSTVTERFGILMTELGPKVQGAAKAFEETTGKAAVTQQQIANIKEEVGTKLLPALYAFYNTMLNVIEGLVNVFSTVKRIVVNTTAAIQFAGGVLKDFITLQAFKPGQMSGRLDDYKKEIVVIQEATQKQKERLQIEQQVNALAREAAKLSLAEQQKVLQQNIALRDASLRNYTEIRKAGKARQNEEHQAALEYVRDRDSVLAIEKVIAQTKDKRTFGGGPDVDPAAAKAAAAEHDRLIKEAEELNKKFHDLRFQSQQAAKSDDQKEIDAVHEKYAKLLKEYQEYLKKAGHANTNFSAGDIHSAEDAEVAALQAKQRQKAFEAEQKQIQVDLSKSYQHQQQQSGEFYAAEKEKQAKRFTDGEIDKGVYEANIAHIDAESKTAQLAIAEKFAAATVTIEGKVVTAVEAAAKDVTRIKKEEGDKQLKDAIANYQAQEAERTLMDELAKKAKTATLQRNLTVAKGKGDVDGTYNAEKELLEQQRQDKLDALDKQKEDALKKITETGTDKLAAELLIETGIRKQIEQVDADFDQAESELRKQNIAAKIEKEIGYAQAAVDVFSKFAQAQANKENVALKRELAGNDKKKAEYKKQLDSKLISQQEYNRRATALDDAAEAKKEEIAKKQFERNKKIQIAQTLINSASGAIKLWADPGFPANIPLAIALGVETVANLALIASQKYAGGGLVEKPDHPGNGKIMVASNIPTQPNGDDVLATVKRGEAVINEEQQRKIGFQTLRDAGVPGFAGGGLVSVKPFWQSRPYKSIDYGRVTQTIQVLKYADGGKVPVATDNEQRTTGQAVTDPALLEALDRSNQIHLSVMETMKSLNDQLASGITAIVNNRQLKDVQNADARRYQESVINPK